MEEIVSFLASLMMLVVGGVQLWVFVKLRKHITLQSMKAKLEHSKIETAKSAAAQNVLEQKTQSQQKD